MVVSVYWRPSNPLSFLSLLSFCKEYKTRAELSKPDISTIKWKGWNLRGEEIVIGNNKVVVPKSKLHKVLCECHSANAHRRRDKTNTYVKDIDYEIPQQVVSLFTGLCKLHAQQKSITDHKKRLITNPISADTFVSCRNQSYRFQKCQMSCT